MRMNSIISTKGLTQFRQDLIDYFSESELDTLCFDLGVDPQRIPRHIEDKETYARELITCFERQGRCGQDCW